MRHPRCGNRRTAQRYSHGALRSVLFAAALAASSAAVADTGVQCTSRAPYAGRPLHAPVHPFLPVPEPTQGALDAALVQRLEAAFERTREAAQAPAMTAAVALAGTGSWQRSAAPEPTPLLYWASAGKTLTAVVVLQLVEEGKLSLDDTVSRWIDDVPAGTLITVRDLLAHTSGLFSANEDAQARAEPRYRDLSEALAIARRHGLLFCPGTNWRYSNTGFDLLGEIVRRVDGRPLDAAITARIAGPLKLVSLRALPPGGGAAGVAPLVSRKAQPIDPSWPGAAGPVAAHAADMLQFWAALLGGRLLKQATVEAMFSTLYPMFDAGTFYGLGTMAFEVPDGERRRLWLGHAGGTPGASAIVLYAPAERAFVAVALTGDGPAAAVAYQLLKELRTAATTGNVRTMSVPLPGSVRMVNWPSSI